MKFKPKVCLVGKSSNASISQERWDEIFKKKINPCPKCGGEGQIRCWDFSSTSDREEYSVACEDCDMMSMPTDLEETTIELWNKLTKEGK